MNIHTTEINNDWILYTLKNKQQMSVSILNFGGIITEILVPNLEGTLENVVLRYKNYDDYEQNPYYFGAIIGRTSGRIHNASCTINGEKITLPKNEGPHHLHGGPDGFHQVIWNVTPFETNDSVGLKLHHKRAHLSDGYPGNIDVYVTYTLTNENELIIEYEGTTDQDTILTMTNHSYFNLSGNAAQTVHQHEVQMNASQFIELDEHLLPTGKKLDVSGTPFDFNNGLKIEKGIHSPIMQNKIASNGYDHYFLLDNIKPINVKDKQSGRVMTIRTDQPGVVMYTANTVQNDFELNEGQMQPYIGICFETQGSPASLQHQGFPSIRLNANEKYRQQTTFKFEVNRG